ncbi:fimbrial protein [Escherichia coli]|uniref:fimbrial protein n=1 Tax=Escherichia coli TaxID=562 RepID=UPI003D361EDF
MFSIIFKSQLTRLWLLGACLLFETSLSYAACRITSETVQHKTTALSSFGSLSPREGNNVNLISLWVRPTDNFASATCSSKAYMVYKLENTLGYTGQINSNGGRIYKTSIDGIGISTGPIPFSAEGYISEGVGNQSGTPVSFFVFFTKYSNNTVSGILNSAFLPTVRIYATESASGAYDSSAVTLVTYTFTGSLNYIVPTCEAENKEVSLGQHQVSHFTGSSATEWVDAGITMNCDRAFSNAYISQGLGTTIRPDNYYSVTIQAVNGFTNRNRGIMALDANGATGLGIQISRTQAEQTWSSLTWTDLNTPAANTIKIPLYARYIKTGNTVTAGQANSKLIYTVQYK